MNQQFLRRIIRFSVGLVCALTLLGIWQTHVPPEPQASAQSSPEPQPPALVQGQVLPAAQQTKVVTGESVLWQAELLNGMRLELTRTFQKIAPTAVSKLHNVYTGKPSEVEGWLALRTVPQGNKAPIQVWRSASFANVLKTVLTACYDGQSVYIVLKWDGAPTGDGLILVPIPRPVELLQISGLPLASLEQASQSPLAQPQSSTRRLTSAYTEGGLNGKHILVSGEWKLLTASNLALRLIYQRGDTIEYQGRDDKWKLTKPFQPRGYVWKEKIVPSYPPGGIAFRYHFWEATAAELAAQKKEEERRGWMDAYRRNRQVMGDTREQAIHSIRRDSGIKDWEPLQEAWDTPDYVAKPYPWPTPTPSPTPTPAPVSAPPVPPAP